MCNTERLKELAALKDLKKQVENSIKEIESEIYADYGKDKTTVKQDDIIIKINVINRDNMDVKRLKSEHPSIYQLYKKPITYTTITIKEVL